MSKTSDVEASSDKSSRSTTPNSTSTYRYSHEPFETLREKVRALAPHIGARSINDIVRLPGGSFNRIIAATIHLHDPGSAAEKVILRIPRFAKDDDPPNGDIRIQFSILETLSSMGIQVPRILAYDCTSDNTIGMPFSLQTRIEGQGLDLIYQDLTTAEKLSMASELVRVLVAIENVNFQHSDRLCCSPDVPTRKTSGEQITLNKIAWKSQAS